MDVDILKLIKEVLRETKSADYDISDDDKRKSNYHLEPIIKKASELAVPAPLKYKEMLKIVPKNNTFYWQSDYINARFYLQAKYMENFEDDYAYYGEVIRYLPQYTDMTIPELRGYFTWRTKVRKGIVEETSISYVFIYIYELINGIGVASPEDGFEKLLIIWKEYRAYDTKIDRYLKDWLKDYIIYYGMDHDKIKDIPGKNNVYLFVLSDIQRAIDEKNFGEFLEQVNAFSNYKILKSKFLKDFKKDYVEVFAQVYEEIKNFYIKNRKANLFEKMFGKELCNAWLPFRSGIFYENIKIKKRECKINDFERYVCVDGEWMKYSYSEYNSDKGFIGEMLRTTEFFLREKYNYSYKITFRSSSKVLTELIEKTVDKYCEENNKRDLWLRMKETKKSKKKIIKIEPENTRPLIIDIDTSKFEKIRKTAQSTQEKLMIENTEEEKDQDLSVTEVWVTEPENQHTMQSFADALSKDEKEIMKQILNNRSDQIMKTANDKNKMISVLLEAINEKALAHIEDNILEMNDDIPWIFDEYREELQEVL